MSGYRNKDRRYGNMAARWACRCGIRTRFGEAKCPGGQGLLEDVASMAVIPCVAELITSTLNFQEAVEQAAMQYDESGAEKSMVADLGAQILQTEAAMPRIVDAVAEGVITREQAKALNQESLDRRTRLQRRISGPARKDRMHQELREAIAVLQGDVEGTLWRLLEGRPQAPSSVLRLLLAPHSVEVRAEGPSNHRTGRVVEFKLAPEAASPVGFDHTRRSEWKIIAESGAHSKLDAQTAEWRLPVPADGEAQMTYRVRYSW